MAPTKPVSWQTTFSWIMDIAKPVIAAALIGIAVLLFNLRDRATQIETKIESGFAHHSQTVESGFAHHSQMLTEFKSQTARDIDRIERSIDKLESKFRPIVGAMTEPHEQTLWVHLTAKTMTKEDKESVQFDWPLIEPIDLSKAAQVRAIPSLVGLLPDVLSDVAVQLRATITPDGKTCRLHLTTRAAPQLASYLRDKNGKILVTVVVFGGLSPEKKNPDGVRKRPKPSENLP